MAPEKETEPQAKNTKTKKSEVCIGHLSLPWLWITFQVIH